MLNKRGQCYKALCLALAMLVDLLWGELPTSYHPVVWMGRLINTQKKCAPKSGNFRQGSYGLAMVVVNLALTFGLGTMVVRMLRKFPYWLALPLESLFFSTTFSAGLLVEEGNRVARALANEDLGQARLVLRSLVSRPPDNLNQEQIIAATIESLAENTGDSIVAPLWAFTLGGLPAALAYRMINTMDAMIGYRGEYEWLGKAAARADDVANFLPARLAAFALLLAAPLVGASVKDGWKIGLRDHKLTASPNAGWPMSVVAGMEGVRLEKVGHYALGDQVKPLNVQLIYKTGRLLTGALLVSVLQIWLYLFWQRERNNKR